MLPLLHLRPGSAAEWLLVGLAALATAIAALVNARARQPRHAVLLVAYLGATFGIVFAVHALFGASVFIVSPYALTLSVAVLVAWSLSVPRLRSVGVAPRLVFLMIFGCLVLGILGSRAANALSDVLYSGSASSLTAQLASRDGGLGVFGAIAVDALFLVLLFRHYPEQSLSRSLDATASAIAVNVAIGRFGCLLGGCCYGKPTSAHVLSVPVSAYQPGTPAAIAFEHTPDASLWLTQPLEAAAVFAIALGCEALYRRRAQLGLRDGAVIAAAAGAYGAVRALAEILRGDSPRFIAGTVTLWQLLGLLLLAASSVWAASGFRRAALRTRAPRERTRQEPEHPDVGMSGDAER